MMNNEIMVNEEIIDAVEEAVTSKTFEEGLVYGSVGTSSQPKDGIHVSYVSCIGRQILSRCCCC